MKQHQVEILDQLLPLKGASHADVIRYGVDIPMRYSECYAKLADGRIIRLRNSRQFIGWAGMNGSRRLLFREGEKVIELQPGAYGPIDFQELQGDLTFVARDGSLQDLNQTQH